MAEPMIIPFDLGNAGAMVKAMGQTADQTQRLAVGYRQALGPAQRLLQAQMQLRNASLFGSASQQFDSAYRVRQAQQSYTRAQNQMSGNDLGRALKNALLSTRFGVGGQGLEIMPLIGRAMAALSEAGPFGMAIAAGVAALTGFAAATAKAAEAANDFARAFMATGATPTEASNLSTVGGALGLSNQQMGQMASQFAHSLATDPYVMAIAARYGIRDPLGNTPFGRLDRAQNLLRAMEAIRSLPQAQAVRFARQAGLEPLLSSRMLSQQTMNRLRADASVQARVFNPQFLAQAQEFSTATARVGEALTNLLASVSGPMLHDITNFFNGLADAINQAAQWFASHAGVVKLYYDFFKSIFDVLTHPLDPRAMLRGIQRIRQDMDAMRDPKKQAQDDHTKAVKDNTETLKDQIAAMKGIFGGGQRARGAYPSMGGMQWNNQQLRESISLGAFSL